MPDDYYVSQYSGEEIDALLGGAGTGTVRYDAAQTLTDSQKQQARGNIAAAPDGYGIGSETAKTVTNWDDAKENGIYKGPAPSGIGSGSIIGVTFSNSISYKVHILYPDSNSNCSVQREMPANGTWGPWEWVNPPMQLGIEYRTTERYLGKPVYVKAINFGELPNNSAKSVAHGISNMDICFMVYGHDTANKSPIPTLCLSGNFDTQIGITATGSDVVIHTNFDFRGDSAIVVMKYTKTTD